MARRARILLPGFTYHVGVHGTALVHDDDDRRRFMAPVRAAALRGDLALHAWCLRDAGFAAIVTPHSAGVLPAVMQAIGREHAPGLRRRHGHHGALWRGRFVSSVLEPGGCTLDAQLVVEHAPVRDGTAGRAEQYPHGSARVHCGLAADPALTPHASWWALGNTPFDRELAWMGRLDRAAATGPLPESPRTAEQVLRALAAGHPLAGAAWLDAVRAATGVAYHVGAVGRPRRTTTVPSG